MKFSSSNRVMFLSALCAAVWCLSSARAAAQTIALDDFESDVIRVVNAAEVNPATRFLWSQYQADFSQGPDPGVASVSTTHAHDGTRSLKVTVTGGNLYLQFYPIVNAVWGNARDFVLSPWQMNTFNRLRFWIKVPSQVQAAPPGRYNLSFGTFVRKSNGDPRSAEDGGGHWYHNFNIGHTGEWHQVIVDAHPNHQRGGNGDTEWGLREYPTGESGYNYFDALTRFYLDIQGRGTGWPGDFYVDGFEFYRENRPENVQQVYGLSGTYVRSSNQVMLGWQRHKDENTVKHEVRYAFQDIFQLGWANAIPAPGGVVSPPGWQGYNGMEWSTSGIDLTGKSVIYVAIKPQNSSSFRQIAIPVVGGSRSVSPTAPVAPSNLRIAP